MNIENLIKLRDYVYNNVTSEMFDMYLYRYELGEPLHTTQTKEEYFKNCGTVGCLLGYIIHAIPEIDLSEGLTWHELSKKYLGVNPNKTVWCFLFSSDWSNYSQYNTPEAAVERINLLLEHGEEKVNKLMHKHHNSVHDLTNTLRDLRRN